MGMMSLMVALNHFATNEEKIIVEDHANVVSLTLFVALLCLCLLIGHLLEGNRWINESIVAVFVVRHHNLSFLF
jgi:branched-subunit amino acid transport protein AzlD